jgi:uncharacterized protein
MFGSTQHEETMTGTIPEAIWNQGRSPLPQLPIAEFFRKSHGLHGTVDEFREDETECALIYNGPGYNADITIQRPSGTYELHTISEGAIAVLNDLHKGRHTGPVWSWLIDLVAVLLIIVSASGIALLCFIKRRRVPGFLIALFGTLVVAWVAWKFIP